MPSGGRLGRMFTSSDRAGLRDGLVVKARSDLGVTGAALLGSTATDSEDEWSDIDLALKLSPDTDPELTVLAWTEEMYAEHDAVHHVDLYAGRTRYRAFLLGQHAAGGPRASGRDRSVRPRPRCPAELAGAGAGQAPAVRGLIAGTSGRRRTGHFRLSLTR